MMSQTQENNNGNPTDQLRLTKPDFTSIRNNPKSIAFVGIMGAMGAVLAFLSNYIKLSFSAGVNVSVDLSHIGTFIVALTGGPILGMIAGGLVGLIPAIQYFNFALIPGKMITGFFVGFIYSLVMKRTKENHKSIQKFSAVMIAGLLGYIPEYLFTIWDMRLIVGIPGFVILPIMIKAPIEIILISILMGVLINRNNIKTELEKLIPQLPEIKNGEILGFLIWIGFSIMLVIWLFIKKTAIEIVLWNTIWIWIGILGTLSLIFFISHGLKNRIIK